MADSLDEPHLKEAVERLTQASLDPGQRVYNIVYVGVRKDDLKAILSALSTATERADASSARVKALEGERTDATSLARRAILAMARVQGMLEEGVRNAAILRTESVYVPAPMAREFIALAKALQEEDLGDARSTLTEAPGHE